MMKFYFFLLCSGLFISAEAQINIPDANFKAKLLQAATTNDIARDMMGSQIKIDLNSNNEIEISEALNVYHLNVGNLNSADSVKISNLSGLEYFTNLVDFHCADNLLTNVDLSMLTSLQYVSCVLNQITVLNVSGLDLISLSCEQNFIGSLDLAGMTNLGYLDCLENELTALDLSGLTSLGYLRASHNQIPVLDFTGLTEIGSLQCMDNLITTLDVSQQHNLDLLMVGSNPFLETIFMKNGKVESGLNMEYLPALQYVCVDDAQLTTIQNQLSNTGTPDLTINSYCSFTPGGVYYTVQGNNKFDFSSDGCDDSDIGYPFMKFLLSQGDTTGNQICDASGSFNVFVGMGTHTITPILDNPQYFSVSPMSATVTFPDQPTPLIQNFCVTANGNHPDLEVVLIPLDNARPGFDSTYMIAFKNKGNQLQSGSVSVTFNDTVLDFVNASPLVTTFSVGMITWDFSDLQPFEHREIVFTMNVNSPMETPAVNSGDTLSFTATITSVANEETPDDNTETLTQTVVNSLDPNDKTCLEGATIPPSMVGEYVHYMIRFENTGTFAAENVVVKDVIDTAKFEVSSIVPILGSHDFTTRMVQTNKVEFIFENINLPFDDANNDGFIAFKIKTKPTLALGDTFSNTASIYFDYNYPIVTNTETTTISALSNQDFDFGRYLTIFPNPVGHDLNITSASIALKSISVFNMLGQQLIVIPNAQDVSSIDVSTLGSGTYFIKVDTDRGTSAAKFIKQ